MYWQPQAKFLEKVSTSDPYALRKLNMSNVPLLTLKKVANSQSLTLLNQRTWGAFSILEEGAGYKIKRVEVKPGHSLGLHLHYHRSEHWIVVAGIAKVTCGDQEILLSANQSSYIPRYTMHCLENPGIVPLILIEVQNGEYLQADDIVHSPKSPSKAASVEPAKLS
jgi:mannose-6-phosphate isomerase